MCHCYIFLDLHPSRGNVISLKSWVEYLFLVMNRPVKNTQALISERKNAKVMRPEIMKMLSLKRMMANTNEGTSS